MARRSDGRTRHRPAWSPGTAGRAGESPVLRVRRLLVLLVHRATPVLQVPPALPVPREIRVLLVALVLRGALALPDPPARRGCQGLRASRGRRTGGPELAGRLVGLDRLRGRRLGGLPGSSWFASGNPPVGEGPPAPSVHWQVLAAQGPQGIQGPVGPQGIPGTQGGPAPRVPPGRAGATGSRVRREIPVPPGQPHRRGPQGPEGPQGSQGIQGIQGPRRLHQHLQVQGPYRCHQR